jgi:hypothetical protein
MRVHALLTCVILSTALKAQGILPVLYYVPPTMGCNGVVAIDLPVWNGCIGGGGGPMTMTPMYFANVGGSWTSADTVFIPICDDPCEIVITDDFGNACMCSVRIPTAMMSPTSVRWNGG